MRDIKFRAWDKDDKKWVKQTGNPYVFPFEGIVALTCAGNGSGHISKEDYSKYYELSQYTGLKDKNNKEIYEGDIIKRTDDSLRLVKWSMFGFQLFSITIPDSYWNSDYLDWQQSEIIGNIYENPELLKESK